jgi:hypothetical protein
MNICSFTCVNDHGSIVIDYELCKPESFKHVK